jgi:WD40 repeat protein
VRSLSLSIDGKLISGSEDKTIKIWSIISGELEKTIEGHNDYIRVVLGLTDGRVASAGRDNQLKIWNLAKAVLIINNYIFPSKDPWRKK